MDLSRTPAQARLLRLRQKLRETTKLPAYKVPSVVEKTCSLKPGSNVTSNKTSENSPSSLRKKSSPSPKRSLFPSSSQPVSYTPSTLSQSNDSRSYKSVPVKSPDFPGQWNTSIKRPKTSEPSSSPMKNSSQLRKTNSSRPATCSSASYSRGSSISTRQPMPSNLHTPKNQNCKNKTTETEIQKQNSFKRKKTNVSNESIAKNDLPPSTREKLPNTVNKRNVESLKTALGFLTDSEKDVAVKKFTRIPLKKTNSKASVSNQNEISSKSSPVQSAPMNLDSQAVKRSSSSSSNIIQQNISSRSNSLTPSSCRPKGKETDKIETKSILMKSFQSKTPETEIQMRNTYRKRKSSESIIKTSLTPQKLPNLLKCEDEIVNSPMTKSGSILQVKETKNLETKRNEISVDIFDHHDVPMELNLQGQEILRFTRSETTLVNEPIPMDWQEIISELPSAADQPEDPSRTEDRRVYFVIDTNVFIRSISLIEKLVSLPQIKGFSLIVMVPYQVLRELDKLKSNSAEHIAYSARKATRFLFDSVNQGSKVIFQNQTAYLEDCSDVLIEIPDDHIIKCCCQLKNDNKKVILVSNDVNLCVKCSSVGGIPAVPDSWLFNLINEEKLVLPAPHPFEVEPSVAPNKPNIFIHKLTLCLSNFLLSIIKDMYKTKYGGVWELWLPGKDLPLTYIFTKFESLPLSDVSKKNFPSSVKSFYLEKKSYKDMTAKEVDDFGRRCILFSNDFKSINPYACSMFDLDMGFMKAGIRPEKDVGYFQASASLAQNHFSELENRLNTFLSYLDDLAGKISSQNLVIPDTSALLKKIDKFIIITNEATSVFLMLTSGEELPLRSPEVVILHKVLVEFLDSTPPHSETLPLFSPEDISVFLNLKRSELYPSAVEWLSDVRRRLSEYKYIVKKH